MEIEVVIRMEADTENFETAQRAIKTWFNRLKYIKNYVKFDNFHFMAAQPIEDLHEYEEIRKVGRPKKGEKACVMCDSLTDGKCDDVPLCISCYENNTWGALEKKMIEYKEKADVSADKEN